jgi:hypothetical protein
MISHRELHLRKPKATKSRDFDVQLVGSSTGWPRNCRFAHSVISGDRWQPRPTPGSG